MLHILSSMDVSAELLDVVFVSTFGQLKTIPGSPSQKKGGIQRTLPNYQHDQKKAMDAAERKVFTKA